PPPFRGPIVGAKSAYRRCWSYLSGFHRPRRFGRPRSRPRPAAGGVGDLDPTGPRRDVRRSGWWARRGRGSNPRVAVLQTAALPLRHRATNGIAPDVSRSAGDRAGARRVRAIDSRRAIL